MKIVPYFLLLILIVSCKNEAKQELQNHNIIIDSVKINNSLKGIDTIKIDEKRKSKFETYIDSIPFLKIGYKTECYNIDVADYVKIKSNFIPENAQVLGRLQSIKNIILVIYVYATDLSLPILELYNKNGSKLKDFVLFDYGFCTDLMYNNHFSSFEIKPNHKIEILSYVINSDSIVNQRVIDLKIEIDKLK